MSRLNLWYLPPAFFSAGGPWVRPAPGIPRALCLREGRSNGKARTQHARREKVNSCLAPALGGAQRRSNPACLHGAILDCFASLAMTIAGTSEPLSACGEQAERG